MKTITERRVVGELNIVDNRKAKKWTRKELVARALWETVGRKVFFISPRPLWGFRRAILRVFGAQISADVHIDPNAKIFIPWNLIVDRQAAVGDGAILYSLGIIKIGARATISQYAHLCAGSHDYRSPNFELQKASILIGEDAWVCADAFIGPNVSVGNGAIIGARAVAMRSVPGGAVFVGNPGRIVKWRLSENGDL